MRREAQLTHSRLNSRLEADLSRINFYRFHQFLEKRRPDQPLTGATNHPADNPVRSYSHPGMEFSTSELRAVEYDEADDCGLPAIRTTSMRLYDIDSLLPMVHPDDTA